MKRLTWILLIALLPVLPARAQDSVFPLPAPLYILTSEHVVLRVDPVTGGQTVVSPEDQPVTDFDIAPDGEWYAYRTSSNNGVVVTELDGQSGFVVEFGESVSPSGPAQTIAWSPDAARLAYIVPQGVRIAELGAGEYGEALFSTIQGQWTELYWDGIDSLIVSDDAGVTTRISGTSGQWTVEAVAMAARPQPRVPSYLSDQGVMLSNSTVVPGTAGALAYDWGPLPPEIVDGVPLLADLYFIAADDAGIAQVWRLPASGDPAQQVTAASTAVIGYDVAPGSGRTAYVAGDRLIAASLNGSDQRELAALRFEYNPPQPEWSPEETHIAFHDARGVWIVPADGSQPPRLVAQSQSNPETAGPSGVRVYFDPRWSPDGSRLLIGVGFYEGSILAVLDPATGGVTDLNTVAANLGTWTDDGRVLTWASGFGYQIPGLYLLDPARPDARPVSILGSQHPVVHAAPGTSGRGWYALVATPSGIGPQYVRVWQADTPQGPFTPVDAVSGGFVQRPQVRVPGPEAVAQAQIAGLRAMRYDGQGGPSGDLVVLDARGTLVQVRTNGRVSAVQWGR